MKVVILCGGYGTRIRDVADDIPKPMIPVSGYPILWHIMKYYSHFQINDFVLCLGYKGDKIKDFFVNYESRTNDCTVKLGAQKAIEYHTRHSESDWNVTLADTGLETLTGGRIRKIQKYLDPNEENFMLTYGDGVGDIDIDALLRFHKSHGKILTVTGVKPPGRFGEISTGPGGEIHAFNEKPQASGGRISGGFFVCKREIFDYLPPRDDLTFEQEPMNDLVVAGQIMMYPHDGFWHPMDTYRDYKFLNTLSESGEAPWEKWNEARPQTKKRD